MPSYVLSSSPHRKKSSREKAINGAPPAKIARPSSPIPPHPITPWVASGFSIAHRRSQLELPVDAAPKPLDVTHGSHNYLAGKLSGTSPPASALFPYASTLPLLPTACYTTSPASPGWFAVTLYAARTHSY